jgi:ATP-dependent RNA helicase RhlE
LSFLIFILGFTFIILNFSALKLDKILVANLEKQKLSSLTPIQEIAIPAIWKVETV